MNGCWEQLEIDTKDICLLCLGPRFESNCVVSPSVLSLQGLKQLLRYLKVSPKELFNCSSEFLLSMEIREDIDLKVCLCAGCALVTEKFNKLYQDYKLIQLQVGDCVQSLHESMSKGNEDPERVRKYKDQMRPAKSSDLVNASIAANLRNATLRKCSIKMQLWTPKVALQKPDVKNPSNVSNATVVAGCSKNLLQEPEYEIAPGPGREIQSLENANKSQSGIDAGNSKQTEVPQEPKGFTRRVSPRRTRQMSTKAIPDNEIIAKNSSKLAKCRLGLGGRSTSVGGGKTQVSEHEITLGRKTRSLKNATKSQIDESKSRPKNQKNLPIPKLPKLKPQNLRKSKRLENGNHNAENTEAIGADEIEDCLTPKTPTLLQMSTESTSDPDIEIIAEVKSVEMERNVTWKKNYINSIRKKLKKSKQKHISTVSATFSSKRIIGRLHRPGTGIPCEYCKKEFISKQGLNLHRSILHPEHPIIQFLPDHVSLKLCQKGARAVWRQMVKISTNQCQFCTRTFQEEALKRHMMDNHADQFATIVYEKIQSFPKSKKVSIDAGNTDDSMTSKNSFKTSFDCEYCSSVFTSKPALRNHTCETHPEHIVCNHFPADIPFDACKKGVNVVLEELLKQGSESGYKCKFCAKIIAQKIHLKRHVVSNHAEQIALEAQQIGQLPEHLEGEMESSEDVACSSMLGSQDYESDSIQSEGIDESYECYDYEPSVPILMDVEIGEEGFIKVENPSLEIVYLDPLVDLG